MAPTPSIREATQTPIVIADPRLKPSTDDVLLRLQALRYAHAERRPLATADAPLGHDAEVTFTSWCVTHASTPAPLSALWKTKLPLGFAPFDHELGAALSGRRVGETVEVARAMSKLHPYPELRGVPTTQHARIESAQLVVLPSEQDPAFWKATGLGGSLEAIAEALMEQAAQSLAISARQAAASLVVITLAERIGVNLTTDALDREAAMLFDLYELPRWAQVGLAPHDVPRAKSAFLAAPSTRSWAVREICAQLVLTRMMEESLVDRGALEAALKTLRPPPGVKVEMTPRAAEMLGAAVVSAAWAEISDQLLALPCVKWE